MSKDIERYVKEFEMCIKADDVKHEPSMSFELLSCQWSKVRTNKLYL